MPAPQTLLEMAGAMATPIPLSDCAVIMIDAQLEYVSGRLPLVGIGAALGQGAALLEAARGLGRPILHVAHRGKAGGLFDPDTEFFRHAPEAAPLAGETVIEKALPNAFAGTTLDEVLKRQDSKTLVVAGFMTHMCVSSTVRAALDLGYGCTVLAPACATRDLPDGAGGVIGADLLHRAELVALSDRFATIARDLNALTA